MPVNTSQGYPYPIGTDPIDTAGDMQRLAIAVDASMVAEIQARVGGDSNIQANLDAEQVARVGGDNTLTAALDKKAHGMLALAVKPTDQGGFGPSLVEIPDMRVLCPFPVGAGARLHQVAFAVFTSPTVSPPATGATQRIRLVDIPGGNEVDTMSFHFDPTELLASYGKTLAGVFRPTGLGSGVTYGLTIDALGGGTFSIMTGSWIAIFDVGDAAALDRQGEPSTDPIPGLAAL